MACVSSSKMMKIASSAMILFILLSCVEGNNQKLQSSSSRGDCEEIYVVGEGETLHTISDKCQDPFIVDQNPLIQDSDVYPGLVLKITSPKSRKLLM